MQWQKRLSTPSCCQTLIIHADPQSVFSLCSAASASKTEFQQQRFQISHNKARQEGASSWLQHRRKVRYSTELRFSQLPCQELPFEKAFIL